MASFTDSEGREWLIEIDALLATRVRESCDPKFLLNDTEKENTFERLRKDSILFCQVLFHLCQRQREKREITEEMFYREVACNGDVIQVAMKAMRDAIVFFTPPPLRQLLVALAEQEEMREQMIENVTQKLKDPALQAEVREQMQKKLDSDFEAALTRFQSVLNSPDLSASAPTV